MYHLRVTSTKNLLKHFTVAITSPAASVSSPSFYMNTVLKLRPAIMKTLRSLFYSEL